MYAMTGHSFWSHFRLLLWNANISFLCRYICARENIVTAPSVNNPQWNLENKRLKQWYGGCHGILVYGKLFTHIFCKSFFMLLVIKSVKHHIKAQVYLSWRWSKTSETQHCSCHKQKEYTKSRVSLCQAEL